jgi:hypothetical protein
MLAPITIRDLSLCDVYQFGILVVQLSWESSMKACFCRFRGKTWCNLWRIVRINREIPKQIFGQIRLSHERNRVTKVSGFNLFRTILILCYHHLHHQGLGLLARSNPMVNRTGPSYLFNFRPVFRFLLGGKYCHLASISECIYKTYYNETGNRLANSIMMLYSVFYFLILPIHLFFRI